MDWPFSRHFSISISSFTPSTTICTSATSEKPRRSALETSNTPPTAAVSTPPESKNTNRDRAQRCKYKPAFTYIISTPTPQLLLLMFAVQELKQRQAAGARKKRMICFLGNEKCQEGPSTYMSSTMEQSPSPPWPSTTCFIPHGGHLEAPFEPSSVEVPQTTKMFQKNQLSICGQ